MSLNSTNNEDVLEYIFFFSADNEDVKKQLEAYEIAIEEWKDELAKAKKVRDCQRCSPVYIKV